MAYKAIEVLSGKQTDASIVLQFLGTLKADRVIMPILVFLALGYGLNERRLRQNNAKRMGKHIEDLEMRLDGNRSSSNLTKKGTTRKEDR